MATTKPSRSKVAPASARVASPTNRNLHHTKAPFGFVFLFLLLTSTFMFSTFYVITQAAREQAVRREALSHSMAVNHRVDAVQAQVTILSAQIDALKRAVPVGSTTNTLPVAQPAK